VRDSSGLCIVGIECPTCSHGSCNDVTGVCECDGNWAGSTCEMCAEGYGGKDCADQVGFSDTSDAKIDSNIKALNVFAIVLAILAIFATIMFLIYRRYRQPKPYAHLESAELNDLGEQEDFLDKDEFPEQEDSEHEVESKNETQQNLVETDD